MSNLPLAALMIIALATAVIAVLIVSRIARKVVPPGKTLTALDFISDTWSTAPEVKAPVAAALVPS